ncbi:MAG: hypothetical protein LBJ11_03110 [Oscillospiraceae bacterium]|nr:hypothetical protein [Oscillospiraceae bacterium]
MKIARVFPRRTKATPDDKLTFTVFPKKADIPEVDEVHISVAFTYDLPKSEAQEKEWRRLGVPVRVGGPALGRPGGDFTPGVYLKKGYVITSRGCNNHCWFCGVPKREGGLRELPVTEGWNVVDDNLLGCSERHIREVFSMLKRQPEKPVFTGGLEAKLLRPWHVDLLRETKTQRMYFAYDTPDDYEPLVQAGRLLREGGVTTEKSHNAGCYVLIGYPGDTMEKAETRLRQAWAAGFFPYAMLYRDNSGETNHEWRQFQRMWVRPQIVACKLKERN